MISIIYDNLRLRIKPYCVSRAHGLSLLASASLGWYYVQLVSLYRRKHHILRFVRCRTTQTIVSIQPTLNIHYDIRDLVFLSFFYHSKYSLLLFAAISFANIFYIYAIFNYFSNRVLIFLFIILYTRCDRFIKYAK